MGQVGADDQRLQDRAVAPEGRENLTINMEIDDEPGRQPDPATMHPSIPEYAIFCVTNYPRPGRRVTIARCASRTTGVRPRGFVLRSYVDMRRASRAGRAMGLSDGRGRREDRYPPRSGVRAPAPAASRCSSASCSIAT